MTADNRYVLFDDAMGASFANALLDFAAKREEDFTPAGVYHSDRGSELATTVRDCLRLADLGEHRSCFERAVRHRAGEAAERLGLHEPRLEPAEYEICSYGDGGSYQRHRDAVRAGRGTRVLTCVYYFSELPRPFDGGELRIHGWPAPLPGSDLPAVDIEPLSDRLVFLPSILPHEVRPVQLNQFGWRKRRFNLTCWLWRPDESN